MHMNNDNVMNFFLKRDLIVKEASIFRDSKYYSFTNKIQVVGKNKVEWLIHYVHESIHYYINQFPICNLRNDYAFLFNYLHYFYIVKKSELLIKHGVLHEDENDAMSQVQYVMSHQHEIDLLLSKDSDFVRFCRFCINIYNIYLELLDANIMFNEGIATYYCVNVKPDSFLFTKMDIPDIFKLGKSIGVSEKEIIDAQERIKKTIRHEADKSRDLSEADIYEFGYEYTYLLSDLYGDRCLLEVLVRCISMAYDIYEYDLIDCDEQERKSIINQMFSFDTMYMDMLLKASDITAILSKNNILEEDFLQLFRLITHHVMPGRLLSGDSLFTALDRCLFKHPLVVVEIEKILGRSMTEVDYAYALRHMSLQHSGELLKSTFENEELRRSKTEDIRRLLDNNSIFASKNDKYAERNFKDSYLGMKTIVRIAENSV